MNYSGEKTKQGVNGMRPIDADALVDALPKVDIDKDSKTSNVGAIADFICMIADQPTIDPVKHGHWIIGDWNKSDGVYPNQGKKCSCCFRTCHITQVPWDAVYCPWCGAKMDG